MNTCGACAAGAFCAGESFHEAASRGLHEELGINADVPEQPLGPMHKRSLVIPGQYVDIELVQSYRVDGFEGQVCNGAAVTGCYRLAASLQCWEWQCGRDKECMQEDTAAEDFCSVESLCC